MGSEMQERVARALFEARAGRPIPDEQWGRNVGSYRELVADWPDHAKGGDGISDAFRDALAAMEAMREPTQVMAEAFDKSFPRSAQVGLGAMLDAEIEAAKKGL